eukprot:g1301.t1
MRIGGPLRTLVCTACIGGFLFGYDTGVISGAMLQMKASRASYPAAGGFGMSSFQQEVVVSAAIAGAIAGALGAGFVSERFGRRPALVGAATLFTAGALLMAAAPSYAMVVFGRVVVGVSVGISSTVVPMYIAEAAPAQVRGELTVMNNVMVVLGQVCAAAVDCAFASAHTREGWRYMLGLGAAPALAMLWGMLRLPESPRWLAQHGGDEGARALVVLRALRGERADEGAVRAEMDHIREGIVAAGAAAASSGGGAAVGLAAALGDPRIKEALKLGCMLQFVQQFTGINTLMYYSATILQVSQSNQDDPDPFSRSSERAVCLSAATAAAQMAGNLVGMGLVERSGRRTLTLWSLAAVCATLVLLGVSFHGEGSTALALVAMVAYLLFFGIGLAPMPWTVNAEIYPLHVRSRCIAITTGVNWAANFVVSLTFLSLGEALSTNRLDAKHHPDGVFWLYAGVGALCWFWLYLRMPETKGLSLEAISKLFEPGSGGGSGSCWAGAGSRKGEYEAIARAD